MKVISSLGMLKAQWVSGKSSGCIMELVMRGMQQEAFNGVRRTRWAIIRNTYPELKTTTIKTFEHWVPTSVAPVVYTTPINAKWRKKLSDGTDLDMEFIFLAMDSAEDVKKLLSLEITGGYINEAREVPEIIFQNLRGRVGRYPAIEEGCSGPTWAGIIADSNPPQMNHWTYTFFETGTVASLFQKFKQPAAVYWDEESKEWILNPDAENLEFLATNYYRNQLEGNTEDYIRVMLAGEYGMMRAGKPVFPQFSEHKHVAPQIILPIRGVPILLGFDFGLNPACAITQLHHRGIRILDELPATDESLEDFLDTYVIPLLRKKYPGYKFIGSGDPAGKGRSGIDKRTPFDVLSNRGIKAFPALTNSFQRRKECMDWFLARDGGFLISPHCTHHREAYGGGYIYKEQRNNSGVVLDYPDKHNPFSHMMDADQYAALYCKYGLGSRPSGLAQKAPDKHLW